MKKYNKDFPLYYEKNWHLFSPRDLEKAISIILKNKEKYNHLGQMSWLIFDDENDIFTNLAKKFYEYIKNNFNLTILEEDFICNVYYTDGTTNDKPYVLDFQGRVTYHSHKHGMLSDESHTTLCAVYYANIPDKNSGSIDFRISEVELEDKIFSPDADLKYNSLQQKPNFPINGVDTKTIKEITYQPETGDLVLFPSYLDHRPFKSLINGHRIAINFNVITLEHPDIIFKKFDQKHTKSNIF